MQLHTFPPSHTIIPLLLQKRDHTHIFAPNLVLRQLNFNEGPDGGEELPPGPVLHTLVLLDVLLHAPNSQVLDLCNLGQGHRVRIEKSIQSREISWFL